MGYYFVVRIYDENGNHYDKWGFVYSKFRDSITFEIIQIISKAP